MNQNILQEQTRQGKETIEKLMLKKKTTRKQVDCDENLDEDMDLIITKRKRSHENIIKLGLKPKSPAKNKKLRITPPKKTQENKSRNTTPNKKYKKETQ